MNRWIRFSLVPAVLLLIGCSEPPLPTAVGEADLGKGQGNYPTDIATVPIDVKPEATGDGGVIVQDGNPVAVALLVNDEIDVTTVMANTVVFDVPALDDGLALTPIHDLMQPRAFASHLKDIDDDGVIDYLVFHFDPATLPIGVVETCLTGTTRDGTAFQGCETIEVRA